MSTRAQVYIKDINVYFYQHYDGYNLFDTVKKVIARKLRWNDAEYLARMIFSEMIKNDIDGETGYGIGTKQHKDIEYLVTVNCKKREVTELSVIGGDKRVISFQSCS